jgi:hypothetical protein
MHYRPRKPLEKNNQSRPSHARHSHRLHLVQDLPAIHPVPAHHTCSCKCHLKANRLYHQSNDGPLVEKGYDAYRSWFTGSYQVSNVPPRAAIAATSFNATFSGINIRVFRAGPDDQLREKAWDNGWHDGILNQASIPGPQVAVIHWGDGLQLNLRVYLQRGVFVSGVSEWAFSRGEWMAGQNAIPPA